MITNSKIKIREYLRRNLINYLNRKTFYTRKNTLLIVRIDAIGDYILFRNFLRIIKESDRFRNYKITLLGNIIWKDLAEEYDSGYVDEFVWINPVKFFKNSEWADTLKILLKLHGRGFEKILIPSDTENWRTDFILKHTGAKRIVTGEKDTAFSGNGKISKPDTAVNGSRHNSQNLLFQFFRNKKFTEELTGKSILLKKPFFENAGALKSNGIMNEDYIVIFPGASDLKKMWSAENFGILCRKISDVRKIRIVICGSDSDKAAAEKICKVSGVKDIEDRTRDGSLSELVRLISNAKLLVTNDTCALHIGAALDIKTICISNGLHFGRFHPYPDEVSENVITIYPDKELIRNNNTELLLKKFQSGSELDINHISPDEVFRIACELLTDTDNNDYDNKINSSGEVKVGIK